MRAANRPRGVRWCRGGPVSRPAWCRSVKAAVTAAWWGGVRRSSSSAPAVSKVAILLSRMRRIASPSGIRRISGGSKISAWEYTLLDMSRTTVPGARRPARPARWSMAARLLHRSTSCATFPGSYFSDRCKHASTTSPRRGRVTEDSATLVARTTRIFPGGMGWNTASWSSRETWEWRTTRSARSPALARKARRASWISPRPGRNTTARSPTGHASFTRATARSTAPSASLASRSASTATRTWSVLSRSLGQASPASSRKKVFTGKHFPPTNSGCSTCRPSSGMVK
mmetsp:Transcript_83729/g.223990  ORF Transcript_83729/g.223990 Transcript_83729/m.223990 type:complete len:286 (-) Transcript_83729:154-1011(-)